MFTEDLSIFINPAEFGQTVTLNGVPVAALFDAAYMLGNVGDFGVSGSNPVATLQTALVPADVVGMTLVAGGVSYRVTENQPDGTGISTLQLRQ